MNHVVGQVLQGSAVAGLLQLGVVAFPVVVGYTGSCYFCNLLFTPNDVVFVGGFDLPLNIDDVSLHTLGDAAHDCPKDDLVLL